MKTLAIVLTFFICFAFSKSSNFWETEFNNFRTNTIAFNGQDIIVGTIFGVYISKDDGESWDQMINGLTNLNVLSLLTIDGKLYAGTEDGLFISSNNGESWSRVDPTLFSGAVYTLKENGNNIFAGTQYSGLLRSTDKGISWTRFDPTLINAPIFCIGFSGNNIYAGSSFDYLYTSSDQGINWSKMKLENNTCNITSILVKDNYLFVGTDGDFLFRSTDNGASWLQYSSTLDNHILCLSQIGDRIYAGSLYQDLYYSIDNGDNWDIVPRSIDFDYSICKFICNHGSKLFLGKCNGVFTTSQISEEWTNLCSGLAYSGTMSFAGNDSIVFVINDSQILKSTDRGKKWSNTNSPIKRPSCLAASGKYLYCNSSGEGLFISSDNGNNWMKTDKIEKNWLMLQIVASGSDVYLLFKSKGLFHSSNNGIDWSCLTSDLQESDFSCVSVSGSDIFLGTSSHGFYRSFDNGMNWANLYRDQVFSGINTISSRGNYVYIGDNTNFHLSNDWGNSWYFIDNDLFKHGINSILAVNDMVFMATRSNGVFYSINRGNNWVQENSGLGTGKIGQFSVINNCLYATETGGFCYHVFERPLYPNLLSPLNNVKKIPIKTLFRWDPLFETSSYQIQVSTSPQFSVLIWNEVLSSIVKLLDLSCATDYYWRVRYLVGKDTSEWSPTWCFATGLDPKFNVSITSGMAPLTVNFTNASSCSANQIEWDFGDGELSHEQNPSHIYNTPGTYEVKLLLTNGTMTDSVKVSSCITVTPAVSTEDSHLSHDIDCRFEPNPVSDYLNICIESNKTDIVKLCLFNTLGCDVIDIFNGELNPGKHLIKADLNGMESGSYILVLTHSGGKISQTVQVLK